MPVMCQTDTTGNPLCTGAGTRGSSISKYNVTMWGQAMWGGRWESARGGGFNHFKVGGQRGPIKVPPRQPWSGNPKTGNEQCRYQERKSTGRGRVASSDTSPVMDCCLRSPKHSEHMVLCWQLPSLDSENRFKLGHNGLRPLLVPKIPGMIFS